MVRRTGKAFNATPGKLVTSERRPSRKIKVSLRIPEALYADVAEAMTRDCYSPKKKSLWIEEALFGMARHDSDLGESLVGDKAQGVNKKQMVVALSTSARQQLKESIVRLRLQLPTIEGVQSLVLRCAMRFRIRHPECFGSKD